MAKLPEWCYEALGTMFFTMVTMSSWSASTNILNTAFCVGMSYALMHCVFNSHCPAHFNPVLTAAQAFNGKHTVYDSLWLVAAQYLGAGCGVGLLSKITDLKLDTVSDVAESKELVILVIMSALLVRFFWQNNECSTGIQDAIWFAFAIAIVNCVGGADKNNHMANPAIYTAEGVRGFINAPFDVNSWEFIGNHLAGNLALFGGALVSVLVSKSNVL